MSEDTTEREALKNIESAEEESSAIEPMASVNKPKASANKTKPSDKEDKENQTEQPIHLVRRLTPLECERLQGYPDYFTNVANGSDSARYKALGNSVAIPCVSFLMRGMAYFLKKQYAEVDVEIGVGIEIENNH